MKKEGNHLKGLLVAHLLGLALMAFVAWLSWPDISPPAPVPRPVVMFEIPGCDGAFNIEMSDDFLDSLWSDTLWVWYPNYLNPDKYRLEYNPTTGR